LGTPTYQWAGGYFGNITTNNLNLYNNNTVISRDGAGNMVFTDVISGTKTLAQLTVGSGGNISGSGALNRMAYWDSASTIADTSMYFDIPNNRYGIGTVAPQLMLHLHDGSGENGIQLSYTIGALYSNITSDIFGFLRLMPSGGRVGINDLTPLFPLDVTGTIHSTGDVAADQDINATNDLNAGNDLEVTDDADIGGTLNLLGDAIIKTDKTSARDLTIVTGASKTLVLDTVIFDDLRVPVTSTTRGGSKDPGFSVFKTDGSGSQGVFLYWFDSSLEEELYFTVQIPHSYKLNTTIIPHVHWTPLVTADGTPANQAVRWGFEYTWADKGQTFGNTTIIYTTTHSPADANVVAGKHYYSALPTLTPTATAGQDISSMLICRIFRDATSLSDTYENDAGILEFDIHYGIDTIGSRGDLAK
jgi:hypothetical protein